MGRTLPQFLGNLDAMHARLSLSLPHLEPPSFVCEETGPAQVTSLMSSSMLFPLGGV